MKTIFGVIAVVLVSLQMHSSSSPNAPEAADDTENMMAKTDKIVFTQPRIVLGQNYGLVVVNPDGSNLQTIGPNMNVYYFSVSADGSVLAFNDRNFPPPGQIYTLYMPDLALNALVGVQGINPIVSPNGQSVAFIVRFSAPGENHGIGIINSDGSNFRMLLQHPPAAAPVSVERMKWSDDSKSIIYRFQDAFFSIAIDGNSEPVRLNTDPFIIEPVFEFPSDAFTTNVEIETEDSLRFYPSNISYDGSHAFKRITVAFREPGFPPRSVFNYYLFSYNLNRKTATLLAHSPDIPIFAVRWSPATLQLAFATREGIDIVDVKNGDKTRIVNFNALDNSAADAIHGKFWMSWLRF